MAKEIRVYTVTKPYGNVEYLCEHLHAKVLGGGEIDQDVDIGSIGAHELDGDGDGNHDIVAALCTVCGPAYEEGAELTENPMPEVVQAPLEKSLFKNVLKN